MNPSFSAANYADVVGSVFSLTLMSEQFLFALYHYNSYANNPVMLRSPKPMVMRDIFFTKCTSTIPNPLSCVYVTSLPDCLTNCAVAYLLVKPMVASIGWRQCTLVYVGSGFFSSFAYLFGCQMNKQKTNTRFDCSCTSNGSFAGLCALSFLLPQCYIPFSKRTPAALLGGVYIGKCAYDEYVAPKLVEKRKPGDIELRNWGFVGGVFFSLIYASLFLRTKTDYRLLNSFYRNIHKSSGVAQAAPSAKQCH